MVANLFTSADPEVKANVDEQKRLFALQLEEWQKLDVEYQLDMESNASYYPDTTIESGAYSKVEENGEVLRDFIRKQKHVNLSARLLPKIHLPSRLEATKMTAAGEELTVNDYVKIVEGRGVSGDSKSTSYGRILKFYLPRYPASSMGAPSDGITDGVNLVCMLFETHVTEGQWRTSGARVIEFAKLNEVPVKVAATRRSRTGQATEFEQVMDTQKNKHQPRSLEYAGEFRCAATLYEY